MKNFLTQKWTLPLWGWVLATIIARVLSDAIVWIIHAH